MRDNSLIGAVVIVNQKVAIITVYGSRMKNVPVVSGMVFSCFGKNYINIITSAQGGEELSISIVIDAKDSTQAQQILSSSVK